MVLSYQVSTKRGGTKMETDKNNHGYFLKGLAFGGLLGALAGFLFAPKSGKELRSDIKEKGDRVLGETKRLYSDTRAKARQIFPGVREMRERAPVSNELQEEMGWEA
jgi:gas vesicle protein